MYVRDWMARRALVSPDKAALIDFESGLVLTYRELDERATRLANHLRGKAGVGKGDRIAVLSTNRVEVIETFFAAAKLSAILVPLNYRLTQPELEYILEDCEPAALIHEDDFSPIAHRLRARLPIACCIAIDDSAGGYAELVSRPDAAPIVEEEDFDPETIAMIIYTSGTTGRPKGAMLSHRMLTWNSINTNLGWDLASSDVTTCHAPLFHTGGFNVLTTPLLHIGATVVVLRQFDAARWIEAIEKYRCTVVFGVPTMFQMMLDSPAFPGADLSSLRFFISGGAPCPIPLIEAFQQRGVRFTQGFGLTEVGPNCFKLGLDDAVRKAGSIGFPTFHSRARIVDKSGRDVTPGEVGELIIKGLHVCSGYWRNREATDAALRNGWFFTGDLARQDDEGYFYIAGRAKDMIISGGENIYPAEVEAVLHDHPAVASAAVVGLPDPRWGEKPVAAVIKRQGAHVSEQELLDFCSARLARYKIPKRIHFFSEFPISGSGKIVKRMLRDEIERI